MNGLLYTFQLIFSFFFFFFLPQNRNVYYKWAVFGYPNRWIWTLLFTRTKFLHQLFISSPKKSCIQEKRSPQSMITTAARCVFFFWFSITLSQAFLQEIISKIRSDICRGGKCSLLCSLLQFCVKCSVVIKLCFPFCIEYSHVKA